MKVTLHSHHTASLLLSNDVRSTPWSDNIWDKSDLRWIQQCPSFSDACYVRIWISIAYPPRCLCYKRTRLLYI